MEALLPPRERERATLALPSGKTVSLVERRELLLERDAYLGVPTEIMRARILRQLEDFEKWRLAVEMRNQGASWKEIGEACGVSGYTAKSWVTETREPWSLSMGKFEAARALRRRSLFPKNQEDFAYVLGSVLTRSVLSKPRYSPRFHSSSPAILFRYLHKRHAQELSDRIVSSLGVRPQVKRVEGTNFYNVQLFSSNAVQLINKETNERTTIPPAFLATRKARLNFLRAVYDSRSRVRRRGRRVVSLSFHTKNKQLADLVSLYLLEQGIPGRLAFSQGQHVVRISAANLNAFSSKIGFRAPQQRSKLGA